jgi:hypothetical protein
VFQNTEAARVNIWVRTVLIPFESLLPGPDIYLKSESVGVFCDHLKAGQISYPGYRPEMRNNNTMKRLLFNSAIFLFSID